jgi:hypothetical protein
MGILNDIGDVLSAPRRALWGMAGLPSSGAELVSNMGIAPKGSMLAGGLGMGAEMLGDPMTYLMGGVGALGGEALAPLLEGAEGGGADIEALLSARRAAQEGLVEQAGHGADTVAQQQARFEGMRGAVDPDSLAEANYKSYKNASPEAQAALEKAGVGTGTGEGGATIYGERKPQGVDVGHVNSGIKGQLKGKGLKLGDEAMPDLSPYERYLLMNEGQAARSGGLDVASIHNPADPLADVAMRRAAEINGARPTPTLAGQMEANFMPRAHIDAINGMGVGGLPIDQSFDQTQALLAHAIADRQAAASRMIGRGGMAAIGGAGGLGVRGGLLANSLSE